MDDDVSERNVSETRHPATPTNREYAVHTVSQSRLRIIGAQLDYCAVFCDTSVTDSPTTAHFLTAMPS